MRKVFWQFDRQRCMQHPEKFAPKRRHLMWFAARETSLGFGQFLIMSGVPTFVLSSALSKFKCLAAKHFCLNPLWAYFLGMCPRLDPNDCITDRECAWMSPEETVVVFVQCFYTDVPKTWISNFRNRFLRRTSTSQDRFALRQLLWPD